MLKKWFTLFGLISIILIISGCFTSPDEKAKELYVKAVKQVQKMKDESVNYASALNSYKKAQENIESIIAKYPDSKLAFSLSSGETKISGFSLSEFQNLENSILEMAEAEKDPLLCALFIAEEIKIKDDRAIILIEIAGKYAERGDNEKATQLLSQSLKLANTIIEELCKNQLTAMDLKRITDKLSEIGENEKAIQLLSQALEKTNTMQNVRSKSFCLYVIADGLANAGQVRQSLDVVKTIQPKEDKLVLLIKIAEKLAEAGQKENVKLILSRAQEVAMAIEGKDDKYGYGHWRLYEIAKNYARIGEFEKALKLSMAIKSKHPKAKALLKIADKYIEIGENDKAAQLLSRALEPAMDINREDDKARALIEIAGKYIEIGENDKAAQLLSQALETAMDINSEDDKARALIEIADKYIEIGENDKAAQLLSQALEQTMDMAEEIKNIEDSLLADIEIGALAAIAVKFAGVGDIDKATKLLSKVIEKAKTIKHEGLKSKRFAEIADNYVEIGEIENANQLLSQALESAKKSKLEYVIADTLVEFERKLADFGQEPSKEDISCLSEILQSNYPVKELW